MVVYFHVILYLCLNEKEGKGERMEIHVFLHFKEYIEAWIESHSYIDHLFP